MSQVLDDILSLVRKGRLMTQDLDYLKKYNTQSIAKRAQDFTCQFPCLTADSIPLDVASVLVRNMDHVYANFLQTVVSADSMIDITIDRGPLDYMKRMHQNLRLESVIDEERINKQIAELKEFKAFVESVSDDKRIQEDILERPMGNLLGTDYRVYLDPTGSYGVAFSEATLALMPAQKQELLTEYMGEFDLGRFPALEAPGDAPTLNRSDLVQGLVNSADRNLRADQLKLADSMAKGMSAPKLTERDVKRTNDMQPLGISVRLLAVNDKKEFVQFIDFIIGVKAVLHPVKSADMVENIAYTLQNKNAIFNFVKWTTGEVSLFKDLILHINDAKYNTSYKSRNASPFFPNLRRLKDTKLSVGLFGVRKLVPNSTIILSSFEIEDLNRRFGFDLHNLSLARKVINDLFLMTLVIVDEGSDTVEILYQSSTSFETYSLETIEREVSMSSNKLGKEIGRMISK